MHTKPCQVGERLTSHHMVSETIVEVVDKDVQPTSSPQPPLSLTLLSPHTQTNPIPTHSSSTSPPLTPTHPSPIPLLSSFHPLPPHPFLPPPPPPHPLTNPQQSFTFKSISIISYQDITGRERSEYNMTQGFLKYNTKYKQVVSSIMLILLYM